MSETATPEKKPDAPAPGTEVKASASAEVKPGVETTTQEQKTETKGRPDVEFFKARQEEKLKKSQLAQEAEAHKKRAEDLERRLAEAESRSKSAPELTETPPSVLDDPDGFARWNVRRAERAAEEKYRQLEAERQDREREQRHVQAAESATKWLLSQSHIKEDESFARTVAKQIEKRYMGVASVDPESAARLAYLDACEAKGIVAGASLEDGTQSGGLRPSAPSSGKRTFNRGDVESYIYEATPGTPEFQRRIREVEDARREGRIK